jgi:hypothetical protein
VVNGERLFAALRSQYVLFDGGRRVGPICFETFHTRSSARWPALVAAKPKAVTRRDALRARGFDVTELSNQDYVDAALCAVTAGVSLASNDAVR